MLYRTSRPDSLPGLEVEILSSDCEESVDRLSLSLEFLRLRGNRSILRLNGEHSLVSWDPRLNFWSAFEAEIWSREADLLRSTGASSFEESLELGTRPGTADAKRKAPWINDSELRLEFNSFDVESFFWSPGFRMSFSSSLSGQSTFRVDFEGPASLRDTFPIVVVISLLGWSPVVYELPIILGSATTIETPPKSMDSELFLACEELSFRMTDECADLPLTWSSDTVADRTVLLPLRFFFLLAADKIPLTMSLAVTVSLLGLTILLDPSSF
jgi:hypothetical protein